jgi:hypothetical protein
MSASESAKTGVEPPPPRGASKVRALEEVRMSLRCRSSLIVALGLLATLAGGCGEIASVEPGTTARDAVTTPPEPGGPCVNAGGELLGDSAVFVVGREGDVEASLGSLTAEGCPGAGFDGALVADGFLVTLDDAVVTVEPGGFVTVRGPGYRRADLRATWEVVDAVQTPDGGQVWTLQAPGTAGELQVDLDFDWAEGVAGYAFLANVQTGPGE